MLNINTYNIKIRRKHFETKLHKFYNKIVKIKNSTTRKKYDSILIMMNKLIKYFHIIVHKKNYFVE